MRRSLGFAASCSLLVAAVTAPPATGSTLVDCVAGVDLQGAIDAAAPGDTLVIRGTCVGSFLVDRDLVLLGVGGARLDARGSGTTLSIPPSAGPSVGPTVQVVGLGITGGNPSGIRNSGILTVLNSTISGNTAFGILNDGEPVRGSVVVEHSSLSGNGQAAVYSLHFVVVTLHHSTVAGNARTGVQADHAGSVVLEHSTVSRNGGSGIDTGIQGAVTLDHSAVSGNAQGGISNWNGGVLLDHSSVGGNQGGGIRSGGLGYLTLRGSVVTGNRSDGMGGGIYVGELDSAAGGLTIEDSTISDNTAAGSGGGIYIESGPRRNVLDNVVIRGNHAAVSGGGLYNGGAPLTLTDVRFRDNTPDDCFGC